MQRGHIRGRIGRPGSGQQIVSGNDPRARRHQRSQHGALPAATQVDVHPVD